jgi:signal peptidase II
MSQHGSTTNNVDTSAVGNTGPTAYHSPAALARLLITAAVGLALDLATKVWAFKVLLYEQVTQPDGSVQVQSATYAFLPGWLHFHVTANQGAVFGVGQGNRWLFVAVSVAALCFLFYLFATSAPRQRLYQVIVGMLLAGVMGNLYDRVVFGYVRDMIYMLPGRSWPAWLANMLPADWQWTRGPVFPWIFNVADSLLCTGVALMLVYSLAVARRHHHEREAALAPAKP